MAELAAEPAALRDYMARQGPAAGLARRWVLPLAVPATFTPPAQADRAAMFDTLISLLRFYKTIYNPRNRRQSSLFS